MRSTVGIPLLPAQAVAEGQGGGGCQSLGAKNRLVGGQSINCLHMLRQRCNIAA